jgi:nitroreductase
MDVWEAIRKRKSVREYDSRPVEDEKLEKILEAARLAPSARNLQEWRFVVVKDAETRRKLMVAAKDQSFVGEAPVVIACCAETDGHVMTCGQQCYPIDVAIAIDHMTLQAVEEGLGTCWIGAFHEEKAREALRIPGEIRVVELLALGYERGGMKPKKKTRKPMKEIVHWERWGS